MSLIDTGLGNSSEIGSLLRGSSSGGLLRASASRLHLLDGAQVALLALAQRDRLAHLLELGGGVLVGGVELDRLPVLEQGALEAARLGELLAGLEVGLRGLDLRPHQRRPVGEVVGLLLHQLQVEEHRLVPVPLLLGELGAAVLGEAAAQDQAAA